MRVVFLDVDGVLNNLPFLKKGWAPDSLDPKNIAALNELLAVSGAKIVITSTWRLYRSLEELRNVFRRQGFKGEIIGKTPELPGCSRGDEIQTWLECTSFLIESFVILDGDLEVGELAPRLVQTQFATGLTREDAERAARILQIVV